MLRDQSVPCATYCGAHEIALILLPSLDHRCWIEWRKNEQRSYRILIQRLLHKMPFMLGWRRYECRPGRCRQRYLPTRRITVARTYIPLCAPGRDLVTLKPPLLHEAIDGNTQSFEMPTTYPKCFKQCSSRIELRVDKTTPVNLFQCVEHEAFNRLRSIGQRLTRFFLVHFFS